MQMIKNNMLHTNTVKAIMIKLPITTSIHTTITNNTPRTILMQLITNTLQIHTNTAMHIIIKLPLATINMLINIQLLMLIKPPTITTSNTTQNKNNILLPKHMHTTINMMVPKKITCTAKMLIITHQDIAKIMLMLLIMPKNNHNNMHTKITKITRTIMLMLQPTTILIHMFLLFCQTKTTTT